MQSWRKIKKGTNEVPSAKRDDTAVVKDNHEGSVDDKAVDRAKPHTKKLVHAKKGPLNRKVLLTEASQKDLEKSK